MPVTIGRRKLLAAVGGAAAWPLAGRAQQAHGLVTSARIAFLGAESASTNQHFFDAFRQGMREHGYVDGQNVTLLERWAEGRSERFPELIEELISLNANVILAVSLPAALASDHADCAIPPGGGVDAMGRIVAQKLSLALGQQFFIENRPGAGGVIGTRAAAKAAPDGYTLVMMVTIISLPANTGYDLSKDFAPVGLIASTTPMVYTRSTSPAAINSNAPPWDGGP